MGPSLSTEMSTSGTRGGNKFLVAGSACVTGRRETMEDGHIGIVNAVSLPYAPITPMSDTNARTAWAGTGASDNASNDTATPTNTVSTASTNNAVSTADDVAPPGPGIPYQIHRSLFCDFDGHDGRMCVEFMVNTLPKKFMSLRSNFTALDVQRCFVEVDEEFGRTGFRGGATAIIAIVDVVVDVNEDHLTTWCTICNVGDSFALIVDNNHIVFETTEHKPSSPGEKARILKAGENVSRDNRVRGLAVSGALGDWELGWKTPGGDAAHNPVCAIPDVHRFELTSGQYVVSGCDGVTDAMTHRAIASFVSSSSLAHKVPSERCASQFAGMPIDPAAIAGSLIHEASKHSSDNISASIIISGVDGVECVQAYGCTAYAPGVVSTDARFAVAAKIAGVAIVDAFNLREQLLMAKRDNQPITEFDSLVVAGMSPDAIEAELLNIPEILQAAQRLDAGLPSITEILQATTAQPNDDQQQWAGSLNDQSDDD
jgi:serine/threonine protein phosphatase PrpC